MPRPLSDAFAALQFTLIKGPNNKYNAYCDVCKKTLCNTATARLRAHRNRCRLDGEHSSSALNLISSHVDSSIKSNNESLVDCSKHRDPLREYPVTEDDQDTMTVYRSDNRYDNLDVNMQIVDVESTTRDECVAFGQYVSTQLKKMDSRTCAVVKYKICETLFNAEMGNLVKEQDV